MDLAKLIAEKRDEIIAIAQRYGASNVRIFGSVARGDYTDSSDIDILVNLDSSKFEGMRYFGVIEELHEEFEALLGHKVDVVNERGLKPRIRKEILAEAVSI
ncbi:hypothetical protein GC174_03370 [bacterium]|nr:hypothetical protein [bacterium]